MCIVHPILIRRLRQDTKEISTARTLNYRNVKPVNQKNSKQKIIRKTEFHILTFEKWAYIMRMQSALNLLKTGSDMLLQDRS
jgi:hypothetical protein